MAKSKRFPVRKRSSKYATRRNDREGSTTKLGHEKRVLILRDIGAGTNQDQWESSGEIVSVMDLRGAQMVVDVHPRRTDQFDGQLPLDEFELFVGSMEALWLPKARFAQRRLPNGDIAYEFVFPESLKEILALQRRYGQKTAGYVSETARSG